MSNFPSSPNFREAEAPAVTLGGRTELLNQHQLSTCCVPDPDLGRWGSRTEKGPGSALKEVPPGGLRVEQNSSEHEVQGGGHGGHYGSNWLRGRPWPGRLSSGRAVSRQTGGPQRGAPPRLPRRPQARPGLDTVSTVCGNRKDLMAAHVFPLLLSVANRPSLGNVTGWSNSSNTKRKHPPYP